MDQYTIKTKETVILKTFVTKAGTCKYKASVCVVFSRHIFFDITATFKMWYCRTVASHNKSATHTMPLTVSTHTMPVILCEYQVQNHLHLTVFLQTVRVKHWRMFWKDYWSGTKEISSRLAIRHRDDIGSRHRGIMSADWWWKTRITSADLR